MQEDLHKEVVVYHARPSEGMTSSDPDNFSEILDGISGSDVDIVLHTPGGYVDAVEKFISTLKQRDLNYRVIVPSYAKSGGTVIAISSSEILLGINSELGPIDPQFMAGGKPVPCQFIQGDPQIPYHVQQMAKAAVERMRTLADKCLAEGMMPDEGKRKFAVERLSSSDTYKSHGAVINYDEAKQLGLQVAKLKETDAIWKRIWLLHCCYDHDARSGNLGKIMEGAKNSISIRASN